MAKKNVNTENVDLTMGLENETTQVTVEGLEVESTTEIDYSSIEYLTNNSPIFPEEFTSKKYNADREPDVQKGIDAILEIDESFPKLFALLGKWWENKAARAEIKKMIDTEATSKGINPDVYMQDNMRKFADKYDALQSAVNRLKYSVTYFKPRNGIKDVFKTFDIRGSHYNVNLRILEELKAKHADNREALLDEVISVSQKIEMTEIL